LTGPGKVRSIAGVVGELRSGMTVGIGGWGSRRKPMALVRAIASAGLADLTVVSYGGPDVGLLVAAGAVRRVVCGFVSLDSIPLEPHFRQARQAGTIELTELDEGMLHFGLLAAAHRLPFLPIRAGLGSDVLAVNPQLRTVRSPYEDGQELVAMPALRLDVALVHLNRADAVGNGQYLGPDPYFDDLFCLAAERAFVSCEAIVPTAELIASAPPQSLLVNRAMVNGVVETPGGAHFTSCVPDYGRDEAFQALYAKAAADTGDWQRFRAEYLAGDEASYAGAVRRFGAGQPGAAGGAEMTGATPDGATLDGATLDGPGAPTLAEICVVACAQAWRGDGAILASPMGLIPTLAARLARLTFAPDLLLTDGEATLITPDLTGETAAVGDDGGAGNDGGAGETAGAREPGGGAETGDEWVTEGWLPFRDVFRLLAAGKRHVMMGAAQLDRYGNQNISCIGDWARPKAQLLGVRGAPGNTINHPVSYWIPRHSARVLVERVDMVAGIGYDRAQAAGATAFHEIRLVVTDKAVLDFDTPDHSIRMRSVHPGISVEQVQAATGFPLIVSGDMAVTPLPTPAELALIRERLDPAGRRDRELA
jgi:glutaconate CoA-transferase, subunit A